MGGLKVNRFLWAIPLDYDLLARCRVRPSTALWAISSPAFMQSDALSISTDGAFAAPVDDIARSHYHCLRTSLRPDLTGGDLRPHEHPEQKPSIENLP